MFYANQELTELLLEDQALKLEGTLEVPSKSSKNQLFSLAIDSHVLLFFNKSLNFWRLFPPRIKPPRPKQTNTKQNDGNKLRLRETS